MLASDRCEDGEVAQPGSAVPSLDVLFPSSVGQYRNLRELLPRSLRSTDYALYKYKRPSKLVAPSTCQIAADSTESTSHSNPMGKDSPTSLRDRRSSVNFLPSLAVARSAHQ